jgi:hypothetical protein
MSIQTETRLSPAETTRRRSPIGALVVGIGLGFVVFAGLTHVAPTNAWTTLMARMTHRGTRIDVSSPSVVEKIRQLSRLETVVYSLDKIVSGERGSAYLPDFLVGDKLLLVAHGEVVAGVDLSQLKPSDVAINGESIKVKLPDPQVLSTRIDNGRTRIYSRDTGVLVPADPNLESEVRLAAEQQIAQAALADGVIDKARVNARTSVGALLRGLGFQSVAVE